MATEDAQRQQAIRNIKRKRDLVAHVVSFIVVNIIMVIIWFATGQGYFWPEWVLLATAIGLVVGIWNSFRRGPSEISEEDISREMGKLAAK